jgi:hypothetical protein
VPHGHWKTRTFLAALRRDAITARCVFDGPINGESFQYVEGLVLVLERARRQRALEAIQLRVVARRSPPPLEASSTLRVAHVALALLKQGRQHRTRARDVWSGTYRGILCCDSRLPQLDISARAAARLEARRREI